MIFDACELLVGFKDAVEESAYEQSAVKVGMFVCTDSESVIVVVEWQYDNKPEVLNQTKVMPFCEIETIKMPLYDYAYVYGREIGLAINEIKKSPA